MKTELPSLTAPQKKPESAQAPVWEAHLINPKAWVTEEDNELPADVLQVLEFSTQHPDALELRESVKNVILGSMKMSYHQGALDTLKDLKEKAEASSGIAITASSWSQAMTVIKYQPINLHWTVRLRQFFINIFSAWVMPFLCIVVPAFLGLYLGVRIAS